MLNVALDPIEVPGYIIPYIIAECAGISVCNQRENYCEIRIEPRSVLGMFLTRTIRPDYKVRFYQLTVYSKKIGKERAFSSEIQEFKNNAEFKVDLSFEDLENFYRFLDNIFKTSFYFYVNGYCSALPEVNSIKNAIHHFIEKFDLHEYGYSENQLRILYYRYKNGGSAQSFSNNKSFCVRKFLM